MDSSDFGWCRVYELQCQRITFLTLPAHLLTSCLPRFANVTVSVNRVYE